MTIDDDTVVMTEEDSTTSFREITKRFRESMIWTRRVLESNKLTHLGVDVPPIDTPEWVEFWEKIEQASRLPPHNLR